MTYESVDGRLAYQSYDATPARNLAFAVACKAHRLIWVNNQAVPCLGSQTPEDSHALRVLVADHAVPPPARYYMVSTHPTPSFTLRRLRDEEFAKVLGAFGGSGAKDTEHRVSAYNAMRWRAVDGKDIALILVPYAKGKDGNDLPRVFSLTKTGADYIGELPGWPEALMDVEQTGRPVAFVNEAADFFLVTAYKIFPKIDGIMTVQED